jgi:hypothetical protein
MAQVITGIYRDQATGLAASETLKRKGYEGVKVVAGAGDEAVLTSLVGNGLTQGEAAGLAAVVRNGGAVVSARAEFGEASEVTSVLKSFKPAELRSVVVSDGSAGGSAAPFSDAFGWKVLSNGAAPFSNFFGLNPSVKSKPMHVQLMNHAPAPFSTSLGLKTLSRNPAPFSSLFKLPLLSKKSRAHA